MPETGEKVAELPFNTQLPASPKEQEFLGDYGKQAEHEAIRNMTEVEEG